MNCRDRGCGRHAKKGLFKEWLAEFKQDRDVWKFGRLHCLFWRETLWVGVRVSLGGLLVPFLGRCPSAVWSGCG